MSVLRVNATEGIKQHKKYNASDTVESAALRRGCGVWIEMCEAVGSDDGKTRVINYNYPSAPCKTVVVEVDVVVVIVFGVCVRLYSVRSVHVQSFGTNVFCIFSWANDIHTEHTNPQAPFLSDTAFKTGFRIGFRVCELCALI